MARPVLSGNPSSKHPKTSAPKTLTPQLGRSVEPQDSLWVFSLRYFRQVEHFGVSGCKSNWFVSIIERLTEMSGQKLSVFFDDRKTANDYRFHPVNWTHKNCPIRKSDLDWIDADIRENDEFEIFQFTISKAMGRIVGFFNRQVFYVVLLDPLHNIQPAGGNFNFKVDKTHIASCSLSAHLEATGKISSRLSKCKSIEEAQSIAKELKTLEASHLSSTAVLHFLDDIDANSIETLISQGKAENVTEVLRMGLACYEINGE